MPASERLSRSEHAALSRQKMLSAGLALLAERIKSPIDNVRSTEVADRAGYTPGAFYNHWPSQTDYRSDLRDHVLGLSEIEDSVTIYANDLATLESVGLCAALQAACRTEIATQPASPGWQVQVAMLASNDPDDLAASRQQYDDWIDTYGQFYGAAIEALGLELKPGLTIEWLTRTMCALSEGFSLQMRSGLSDQIDGSDSGRGWRAFEMAVAVLLTQSVQKIGGESVSVDWLGLQLEDFDSADD